jgi:hypothetical protein
MRIGIVLFVVPLGLLLLLLGASWRKRPVEGGERLDALLASGSPALGACWHGQLVPCGGLLRRRVLGSGRRLAALVSLSRDGDLAAALGRLGRLRVVRGSTTRGGLEGLFKLAKVVKREGAWSFTAPDGPTGPARVAKPGTLVLAASTGAPVVPLACAADRAWRAGSWDRMLIPKPFARVAWVVGEPLSVPAGRSPAQLDELAAELQRRLDAACARAEELLGATS